MTLNDIIVSALIQTGRGHDAQTLDTWRDKLTGFANDAICDLAFTIKPVRTEQAEMEGGIIDCLSLERECVRVMKVVKDGESLDFYTDDENHGRIYTSGGDGKVSITYRYMPRTLSAATDEPELPEACQQLIVTYVVARERASGDAASQRGANVYFQLYETGKLKLRAHMGGNEAYKIRNRW